MLAYTLAQTRWLYAQAPESRSVTLWHNKQDTVNQQYIGAVQQLRNVLPKDRVLYDLPDQVITQLV